MPCAPAETSQGKNSQGDSGLNAASRDGGSQAEAPTKEPQEPQKGLEKRGSCGG
ncbi:hypothetical protein ART_0411 [Arthrobacter sp. PAMC 25486]|nr:hypothetical protein ART_0411 [Arthrobacter sp. PAMC 25486]